MGYNSNSESGDFEKLQLALNQVLDVFGSFDNALKAFGLHDMPVAQQYGILFGCLTFVCTVSAVLILLIWGGSFRRMQEQAETGHATLLSPTDARKQRALLLEQLLEARERMIKQNYPNEEENKKTTTSETEQPLTPLTKMLCQVAPPLAHELPQLLLDDPKQHAKKLKEIRAGMPEQYEEEYKLAYRACQDAPGGAVLNGRPEARYEAYARAYAGCGHVATSTYKRSYARLYEATCCATLTKDDVYAKRFETRPNDIVGRHVRLQALKATEHAQELHDLTSGQASLRGKSFPPDEVWAFWPEGPFDSVNDLKKSFVFQRSAVIPGVSISHEAAFAVRHNVTDELLGAVLLTNDNPRNLSVQLHPMITSPTYHTSGNDTLFELEACVLLLDRLLLGHGYRRVQISVDSHDAVNRKWATRLGFTLEGVLYKHQIVREASRDSAVYGLLNSDWKQGARKALWSKLYGKAAVRADTANEAKEAEREEQEWNLMQMKEETKKNEGSNAA